MAELGTSEHTLYHRRHHSSTREGRRQKTGPSGHLNNVGSVTEGKVTFVLWRAMCDDQRAIWRASPTLSRRSTVRTTSTASEDAVAPRVPIATPHICESECGGIVDPVAHHYGRRPLALGSRRPRRRARLAQAAALLTPATTPCRLPQIGHRRRHGCPTRHLFHGPAADARERAIARQVLLEADRSGARVLGEQAGKKCRFGAVVLSSWLP